jgi:hypothetical protein
VYVAAVAITRGVSPNPENISQDDETESMRNTDKVIPRDFSFLEFIGFN